MYHNKKFTCLLIYKFFKTSNKYPILGIQPSNILLVWERTSVGYDLTLFLLFNENFISNLNYNILHN